MKAFSVLYLISASLTGQSVQFQLFKQFLLPFQTTEDVVMLNGFGTIVNSLGKRVKPYLPQICGTILWRLNNKSAKVRQQAADLISRIAVVMKTCQVIIIIIYLKQAFSSFLQMNSQYYIQFWAKI